MRFRTLIPVALSLAVAALVACGDDGGSSGPPVPTETELRAAVEAAGVTPLEPVDVDPAHAALGQQLFFDVELSGNRDIACATCHHAQFGTSDGASLAIGTGGIGIGPNRIIGQRRRVVARNTLDLFGRHDTRWTAAGWDGAVERLDDGSLIGPLDASTPLPEGLPSVFAGATLFALVDKDQMRGRPGDLDVDGETNELALAHEDDEGALWTAVVDRLMAIEGYRDGFAAAWPGLAAEDVTIVHVVTALDAWMASAYGAVDSPFDRWLAGDAGALDDGARAGAALFFGEAGCASCHAGPLLTDQQYYNLAVPQLGPGMLDEEPLDYGRGRETGRPDDRYAFRTPPLRNVALTGPWMHNGAYTTLEGAVRHHLDTLAALDAYDSRQLKPELQSFVHDDPIDLARVRSTAWTDGSPVALSDDDVAALVDFLDALTDPAAGDLRGLRPESVPSGRDVP